MTKRILSLALLLLPLVAPAQIISILSAHAQAPGSVVTVRGVVTNGSELGKIRYLQDASAGIAVYPGTGSVAGFEAAVSVGDSIEVTGVLDDYHGLLEIDLISAYTVVATNVPLPAPRQVTISELSEVYESQLVAFDCVLFSAGGGVFSGAGSYDISDSEGNTAKVYLQSGHPLLGETIPDIPVSLTAILSQYNDFQLLPRNEADFSSALCFYFTEPLESSVFTTTSINVTWGTNLGAASKIHYGASPALGTTVAVAGVSNAGSYNLTDLQPGTVYWVQVESVHNGATIFSTPTPFATQSLSSGQIKVFFNHSIDPAFANGFIPDGQSSAAVIAETIARINAAQQSIDVAMYNNSRSDLTNALKDAYNRGVRIRYVAALDASSTALNPPPPFPVIYGNNEAIMHDKFLVIDADLTDKAWVMNGSLNWTNQNINTDFNNTLFIQDQSLARTYEIEFEEMWGGSGDQPELQNSRFGSNKRDDTPHHFIIGGKAIDSWFSPSDRTTDRIVETVRTAGSEALFATFSFTKDEVGDALVDVFNNHTAVRGMIENIDDPGVEINYLTSVGIDCRPHPVTGYLHHKYGVFDANGTDPIVLTGSHNWTFAAETVNDENTLVIHDYRLASLYKAEFEKRWQEATVATHAPQQQPVRVFPNPATDVLSLYASGDFVQGIEIRNLLGETVFFQKIAPENIVKPLNVNMLNPGHYFVLLRTEHDVFTLPFQKI